MEKALLNEAGEPLHLVAFLGDGEKDIDRLMEKYPDYNYIAVAGNNDSTKSAKEQVIRVEDFSILFTHGHRYNVRSTKRELFDLAREKGADLIDRKSVV